MPLLPFVAIEVVPPMRLAILVYLCHEFFHRRQEYPVLFVPLYLNRTSRQTQLLRLCESRQVDHLRSLQTSLLSVHRPVYVCAGFVESVPVPVPVVPVPSLFPVPARVPVRVPDPYDLYHLD